MFQIYFIITQLFAAFVLGKTDFDLKKYHTYDEIFEYLKELRNENSDIVQLYSIGQSYENRNINALTISTGRNPANSQSGVKKPSVLIESGIHSREWISPATALWIISNILTVDRHILEQYDFHFVPLLNPDGYE